MLFKCLALTLLILSNAAYCMLLTECAKREAKVVEWQHKVFIECMYNVQERCTLSQEMLRRAISDYAQCKRPIVAAQVHANVVQEEVSKARFDATLKNHSYASSESSNQEADEY